MLAVVTQEVFIHRHGLVVAMLLFELMGQVQQIALHLRQAARTAQALKSHIQLTLAHQGQAHHALGFDLCGRRRSHRLVLRIDPHQQDLHQPTQHQHRRRQSERQRHRSRLHGDPLQSQQRARQTEGQSCPGNRAQHRQDPDEHQQSRLHTQPRQSHYPRRHSMQLLRRMHTCRCSVEQMAIQRTARQEMQQPQHQRHQHGPSPVP